LVFEKIKIIEPQMTSNQVRRSDIHPDLFEIYSAGRMRYVLGEKYVVSGEIYDINTGSNLTAMKIEAYKTIANNAGGVPAAPAGEATAKAPQVSEAPRDQVQTPARPPEVDSVMQDAAANRSAPSSGIQAALAILANDIIPDEMTVVYPAIGDEKYKVTVFSDITCPICQRSHDDFQSFQEQGVTLRAALLPRRGMDTPEASIMTKVMCGADMETRKDLLARAYGGDLLEDAPLCDNGYLKNIREIAVATDTGLGVESTPTFMSSNGLRVDGYPRENPVKTIMTMLAGMAK
jgi:protein-disulfide isomerase